MSIEEILAWVYGGIVLLGGLIAFITASENNPKKSGYDDKTIFFVFFGKVLLWPLFLAMIVIKSLVYGLNAFIGEIIGG